MPQTDLSAGDDEATCLLHGAKEQRFLVEEGRIVERYSCPECERADAPVQGIAHPLLRPRASHNPGCA